MADQLPAEAWCPFVLREGSKGPQAVLCAVLRVVARRGREPGPDVWLLLRRNPATDELKCYLSNGSAEMAPERLVWLAGLRWPALAHRAVLPGRQAVLRAGRLRGPQLAGLAPPRHPRHAGPLLRGAGNAAAQKKHPGLTVPQTCLLVDAALPRTGSPTDRAIAIVDYRRARNAAARRSHAQRRRRYCEYLF